MHFNLLPDLVLHKILRKLDAKDITSLQSTNQRLFYYIRANRLHYSKHRVSIMWILLTNECKREVLLLWLNEEKIEKTKRLERSVDELVKNFNPCNLFSYDHEELANMSPLWWRDRTKISLFDIVDFRRYLPHLDRCTSMDLGSNHPINLTEVLSSMETKNLTYFRVIGNGEHDCTDDDLRKIGHLSNNMTNFEIEKLSESSIISNDAILDMIEIGSFAENATISLPRIQDNMRETAMRRDWVINIYQVDDGPFAVSRSNGLIIFIEWGRNRLNLVAKALMEM